MTEGSFDLEDAEMVHCARQLLLELLVHSHNLIRDQQISDFAPDLPASDKEMYFQIVKSQTYLALALTFCKFSEFHTKYRKRFPGHLIVHFDRINSRIAKSKILDLRNKFVGHLFDSKTGRPLPPEKIGEFYGTMFGTDTEDQFKKWWWSDLKELRSSDSMTAILFQLMAWDGR